MYARVQKGGAVVSSRRITDVFIVGGGPAGLAVGIAARQKGLQAIVADGTAPPIEKPCGEGMMPETLGALRDLGVEIDPGQGQKFRGICFAQQGARVAADFPQGPGIGLRRPLLHERLMARAEECGVKMLWNTTVSGMDAQSVQLTHGKIHARWIVGTDGQGSRVRRWSGLEATRRHRARYTRRRHYRVKPWSNYVEIYWSPHAQAYVTPIGREEVCIVVMAERAEHASFDSAFRELPELREKLGGAELSGRERGAVTAMRSLRNVQRGNVALVGDASGGVDAITGEGLRLAFRQALLLAEAMAAGDLRPYQRAHRQLERRPWWMGNWMLWLGRNPRVRGRVIRALRSKPDLFARLLATHVGQGTPAELMSTGAQLGWQLLAI
ncbi:MAG: NAD(P)/FAD-dependent oxidoreductase [Candidatus Acidiferrales bacterium]